MNVRTIGLSILFVGIPLLIGSFFLVRYFGQNKASVGASGLVAGIASACMMAFFMGDTRLIRGGNYISTIPWVVVVSLLLGAVSGFIARRRNNDSG